MAKQVNQIGNGNAGRDINQQEQQPKSFHMPEVMKDELQLEAEQLLAHLENIYNLHGLLRKEVESYQTGNFKASELLQTMEFIRTKIRGF